MSEYGVKKIKSNFRENLSSIVIFVLSHTTTFSLIKLNINIIKIHFLIKKLI